jgi:hypothetical protein
VSPANRIDHADDVVGDKTVRRKWRHPGACAPPALQPCQWAIEMFDDHRDSPQHRQHMRPDGTAPVQCDKPADNYIANESKVHGDRNCDDDLIHH